MRSGGRGSRAGTGRARPAPLGFAGTESRLRVAGEPCIGGLQDRTLCVQGRQNARTRPWWGEAAPTQSPGGMRCANLGPGRARVAPAQPPQRTRVCCPARRGQPLQAHDFMGLLAHQGTASCLPARPLSGVTLDWIGAARVGRRCQESCPACVGCTLGSGLAGPTAGGHTRWVPRI